MKRLTATIILVLTLCATAAFGATRAVQVESLLTGIVTGTGGVLSGGKVYTYAAGTTTAKTTWTDANKTTPQTNPIILDAAGRATVFADGLYKFVIQTSAGAAVKTLDGLKYRYPVSSVITKIANYTTTVEDDVVLVDASAGAVTITLHPVATAAYPITIKKIDSSANTVTIDPNGAETIDGAATVVIATQNTVSQLYSDGSAWRGGQQILTADNSDKVDGFHASQTPGANELPVINASSELRLPGKLVVPNFTVIAGRNAANNADVTLIYAETDNSVRLGSDTPKTVNGHTIWHSNNDGAASTLDADLLDGNSSAYFQPAATAITTGNIGSQTVAAATTATNSAGTGSIPYTRSENGLRIIRGTVSAAGAVSEGSGFTSSLAGTSTYTVAFSNAFSDIPSCTVGANALSYLGPMPTTTDFTYTTLNVAGVATAAIAGFVCIGPN